MAIVVKTTGVEEYLADDSGGANIRALILGAHGAGKTPSAAQWPKPIFASCERGLMSVARNKVPYVEIKTVEDMRALIQLLKRDAAKPVEKRDYRTLVLDTLDAYQRRIIQQRLTAEGKESLSGWADWGWLDGQMQALIESLVNLPVNVVVNLHFKDAQEQVAGQGDTQDTVLVRRARLKGDIKDAIFQDFDLIGQMETHYVADGGERVLSRRIRWVPDPQFPFLRDRSNTLPRFTVVDFTEADYTRIREPITAGIEGIEESTVLEEVATDSDVEVDAEAKGGPVANPRVPGAKKAAAKKTAAPAKKAAAAKTAEPKPEPQAEKLPDAAPETAPAAEEAAPAPEAQPEATDAAAGDAALPGAAEDPWTPTKEAESGAGDAPSDKTEESEEEPTHEEAVATAKDKLGGTVTSEVTVAEDPNRCGFQPSTHSQMKKGHPGCGKSLDGTPQAKINLSLLRAKAKLCTDCMDEFKQSA